MTGLADFPHTTHLVPLTTHTSPCPLTSMTHRRRLAAAVDYALHYLLLTPFALLQMITESPVFEFEYK